MPQRTAMAMSERISLPMKTVSHGSRFSSRRRASRKVRSGFMTPASEEMRGAGKKGARPVRSISGRVKTPWALLSR